MPMPRVLPHSGIRMRAEPADAIEEIELGGPTAP